ncbi:hypothetical protein C6A37_01360 [Desulfobacteraceae bacterium SEEP-SAG9]|nr:hypothetical protein C6A37_01360 [Desulfobacteraceae bacterium SEEP-SAG9]
MISQPKITNADDTSGSVLDSYYVQTEQKEQDPANLIPTNTSADVTKPKFINIPTRGTYHSEGKERQVGWWLGRVDCVFDDYFTAVLEDLKANISIAEFDKDEISPSELSLLVPNARFTLTVTQADKRSGREYVSKLSFSGPAIWTEQDSERFIEAYEKVFPDELFNF